MDQPQPDAEVYSEPRWGLSSDTVSRQLRESLVRQRAQGVGFELAYRLAVQNIQLPHEWGARQIWRDRHGVGLLSDPALIEAWRCAYELRPGPADHVAVLAYALVERSQARDWLGRSHRPIHRNDAQRHGAAVLA